MTDDSTDASLPGPAVNGADARGVSPLVRRWAPGVALLVAAGLLVAIPLLVLLRTALEEGLGTLAEAVAEGSEAPDDGGGADETET